MSADTNERVFILLGPMREVAAHRAFAEMAARLKPYGRVQVNIAAVADKCWHEIPEGDSPWHEYAAYNPALFKFFPHPKIAPHLPAEWVARNRELLLAKAAVLQELGLEAAFWGYEGAFLPESFFVEHPHLRGPRIDHPRRSRKEAYAACLDLPETREMTAWMMAELKRNVPALASYMFRTNDAGGGLCWAAAQYIGPNGPRHCRGVGTGPRVRNLVEALHQGAKDGGGDITVHIDHSNFWQNEEDLIAPLLPPGTFFYQREGRVAHLSTSLHSSYPILGLVDALAIVGAAERAADPNTRVVVMDFRCMYERDQEPLEAVAKVIEVAEATFASPRQGRRAHLAILRGLAERWGGEGNAEPLLEAFCDMHDALALKNAVAWMFHPHYLGVSMRYLTRPLLIKPELLSAEEEAYFRPHIFNPHESEARSDYIDFHGSRLDLGYGEFLSIPGIQRAMRGALSAARSLEQASNAPEREWLAKVVLGLRLWASIIRSCHNFYFGQVIRDRNQEALSGGPRIPPKWETWTGDTDLLAWNEIMRDELDNTNELISLLEGGGLEVLSHASSKRHEDTFLLGPDIVDQLRTKVRLMREHWLDVSRYLATPHK